jgi:plastocyanin
MTQDTIERSHMSFRTGRLAALAALCAALAVGILSASAGAADLDVSLSMSRNSKVVHIGAGDAMGIAPQILRVHVGDRVVFVDDDAKEHHTATGLTGASAFVDDPRWTDASLKAYGQIGPAAWSTGDLAPGARSAPLVAAKPGTYLYGCFFHYTAGMRGEIIVEP